MRIIYPKAPKECSRPRYHKPAHPEYDVQVSIFIWANLHKKRYPELELLNSSLNGVYLANPMRGVYAKKAGMKRGYPDLFLPVARGGYHGLFIELKAERKGAKVTPEQKRWLANLTKQGYLAEVSYGLKPTLQLIENYLKGEYRVCVNEDS